ncbi:hypothetical protein K7X08_018020 [Anisodus acutangulus]|uniref:Pentatricopeptide repeat-containing protein n=1 Tax=Anisodus acutangulus TaxID=402998 RepID=A0A9Q1LYF3_9SOLA|nr:hypothetical protein K7X08_018020 [Anisodus acutangulus]
MINGYLFNGQVDKACELFDKMPQRDHFTYALMITCFACSGELEKVRDVLESLPDKDDIACWNAMIIGYAKAGRVDEARRVFDRTTTRDVVCWNTMIAGYAQCGRIDEAFDLFEKMEPKSIVVWNTIIAGYAQVGQMEKALEVPTHLEKLDNIFWTPMQEIKAYEIIYFADRRAFSRSSSAKDI